MLSTTYTNFNGFVCYIKFCKKDAIVFLGERTHIYLSLLGLLYLHSAGLPPCIGLKSKLNSNKMSSLSIYKTSIIQNLNVHIVLSSPVLWVQFSIASPENMDRIIGEMRLTSCRLDPYLPGSHGREPPWGKRY